ncbi:MAG: hypothetical protein GX801_04875 [Fibrobacter sp.]|nr:hypothetical protein [Fibrobacter sp.]
MQKRKMMFFMFLGLTLTFFGCSESTEREKERQIQDSLNTEMNKTQRRIDSLKYINDSLKKELQRLDLWEDSAVE